MNPECDLSEGAFPDKFHEFVVFKGRGRELVVLLDVGFDELYQSIALLKYGLVDLGRPIYVVIRGDSTAMQVARVGVAVPRQASRDTPTAHGIANPEMTQASADTHVEADASRTTSTGNASRLINDVVMRMATSRIPSDATRLQVLIA